MRRRSASISRPFSSGSMRMSLPASLTQTESTVPARPLRADLHPLPRWASRGAQPASVDPGAGPTGSTRLALGELEAGAGAALAVLLALLLAGVAGHVARL